MLLKFKLVPVLLMASMSLAWSAMVRSSFENGDFLGWTVSGDGWSVYDRAGSDGKKSAMCTVSKGEAPGMKACIRSVGKVFPGAVVKAKLDVSGRVKSKSSKLKLAIMCIDGEGNTLRDEKKTITEPSSKFKTIMLPDVVVPSGTVETYFMVVIELPDAATGNEWWRVDNIHITVE